MPRPEYFNDLHTFIKTEKADDFKFTQSILSSLPKENMQMYFHERNADTEYQPQAFGSDRQNEAQHNAFAAMNINASNNEAHLSAAGDPFEDEKTSDIFGKLLKQFRQLPGHNPQSTPIVFWLLAGYFRHNRQHLKTEGLFRVAAPESDVRELEIHLS